MPLKNRWTPQWNGLPAHVLAQPSFFFTLSPALYHRRIRSPLPVGRQLHRRAQLQVRPPYQPTTLYLFLSFFATRSIPHSISVLSTN